MVVNSKIRGATKADNAGALFCRVAEKANQAGEIGAGLCAGCAYVRRIESARGSTFYLCQLSATDPNFSKYPRLPVMVCSGFEQKTES